MTQTKPRIALRNGDEWDALTWAKRHHIWRAGDRRKIKRGYRRRMRRVGRLELRSAAE